VSNPRELLGGKALELLLKNGLELTKVKVRLRDPHCTALLCTALPCTCLGLSSETGVSEEQVWYSNLISFTCCCVTLHKLINLLTLSNGIFLTYQGC
jgi:hypothetical protein